MMVLPLGEVRSRTSPSSTTTAITTVMQKTPLRRRRSKGTIVAFGNEKSEELQPESSSSAVVATAATVPQPQHATDGASPESNGAANISQKPSHSGRLALMCAQNAVRMGARTQLHLCPPGRARREVQSALRERNRTLTSSKRILTESTSGSSYFGLDKMVGPEIIAEYDAQEEEFLLNTNAFDSDSAEEASSGDEDILEEIDELFSEESPASLDDDEKYLNLQEPLFVSARTESALSNPNGAPMSAMGPGAPGKLPFNRRKIRYFDSVSAIEKGQARAYLQRELRKSKRRSAVMLSRHLRKVQREERRKRRLESGDSAEENNDVMAQEEKALSDDGVGPFEPPMTPAGAAALLLESLTVNPLESVEGMAKCYEGIVAAGVALLDAQTIDPTSLNGSEDKGKHSRSEVMAALAPLLITSLEQPSGEVILMLAKLRRMCGTVRYQRRFVQRVAPCLIRPPRGAMWCVQHQNDMEAILAAAELIFDSAFDVFSKGWYERGQLLLADSKRAETLNTAAKQLRNLSSEPDDSLSWNLSGHGNRRRLMTPATKKKSDVSGSSGEPLAEWEVRAVDRQIRVAISNVMTMDWSRALIHAEIPKPHNRRATGTSGMKRISTYSQAEMSPKSLASPRSPSRPLSHKTPHSPSHLPSATATNSSDTMENVLCASFTKQLGFGNDRAISPPPPNSNPASPPPLQRTNSKEHETKTPMTPPRSPISPVRPSVSEALRTAEPPPPASTLSPKRGKMGPREGPTTPTPSLTTPLSPSASSVGTTGSGEIVTYRPSSSSVASSPGSSVASHYRMLTSTAAERKRTVAACRALRAQIQRFEDAFIQLHGRPPKGTAERAPLATTYAQYREWKRAIRADAACRIQALFRGASTRWKLLRMNNPKVTRVIMNRAARSRGSDSIINQISIPVEIGQAEQERSAPVATAPASAPPEAHPAPGPSLAPQWARRVVQRRSSSDRDTLPPAVASPVSPQAHPAPAPSSTPTSTSDLQGLSLKELQERKRDLKHQLKQYDMNFARRHGRMPVKAEKEPIRHLYESYNALKSQISLKEQEERHFPTPTTTSPVTTSAAVSPRVTPPSGSESGNSGSEDSTSARASPMPSRSNRRLPRASSPPVASASASTSSETPSQDLAALKAEKSQLHQMLRSYERDFFREHNRQVSSFNDIRPVASQYRRYKEIKRAIAALQQRDM